MNRLERTALFSAWAPTKIAHPVAALDTSVDTVARTRQQLGEEGVRVRADPVYLDETSKQLIAETRVPIAAKTLAFLRRL